MWHFSTRITLKNQRCEIWVTRYPNLWQPKAIVTRSSRSLSTAWCATRSDAIFGSERRSDAHVVFGVSKFYFSDFAMKNPWFFFRRNEAKLWRSRHPVWGWIPFHGCHHQDYQFLSGKVPVANLRFPRKILGRDVIPRYGTSEALESPHPRRHIVNAADASLHRAAGNGHTSRHLWIFIPVSF